MKSIVITGSSRGIGRGLANEFLRRGHQVCVSGSSGASTDGCLMELRETYGPERVLGQPCDVRVAAQVQALWDAAVARFGRVDIWINNAGVGNVFAPIWELDPHDIDEVASIDLAGLLHGVRVACRGMRAQASGGLICNMEGFGSGGEIQPGLSVYGAAKRGVRYVNRAIAKELEGSAVRICGLNPGIVVTDFLLRQQSQITPERWERSKKVFNILGDRVETVSPFLVDGILAEPKNGGRVAWLTPAKAFLRFALSPVHKRALL